MVFKRCAQSVCYVAAASVLLGCAQTRSDTPSDTTDTFFATTTPPCLTSSFGNCGGATLSLLNPMEDVEYLTRAELVSESASQKEYDVYSDAQKEPQHSLTDQEEE